MPGDGIGPEIAKAVRQVFEVAEVPLLWEEHHFSPEYIDPSTNSMVTRSALDSLLKNQMGLKVRASGSRVRGGPRPLSPQPALC